MNKTNKIWSTFKIVKFAILVESHAKLHYRLYITEKMETKRNLAKEKESLQAVHHLLWAIIHFNRLKYSQEKIQQVVCQNQANYSFSILLHWLIS